ncbi:hypothetical protein D3C72_1625470 [compost metagenome]
MLHLQVGRKQRCGKAEEGNSSGSTDHHASNAGYMVDAVSIRLEQRRAGQSAMWRRSAAIQAETLFYKLGYGSMEHVWTD